MNKVSASGALALCLALSACNTSGDGVIGAVGDMPGTCLKQARASAPNIDPPKIQLATGALVVQGGYQVQAKVQDSPVNFTCSFDGNAKFVSISSGIG